MIPGGGIIVKSDLRMSYVLQQTTEFIPTTELISELILYRANTYCLLKCGSEKFSRTSRCCVEIFNATKSTGIV